MSEEALEGKIWIEALSKRKGDSSGGVVSTLSWERVRRAPLEVVVESEAGGSPQSEVQASLGYRVRKTKQANE